MQRIELLSLIAPQFYDLHHAIKDPDYREYMTEGGRGSCKSSTISLEIPHGMLNNPLANAVCLRRWSKYLHGSVYNQIIWALDKLNIRHLFKCTTSPLEIRHRQTGQRIIFLGADDPDKIKSLKVTMGYVKYIWFEELTDFRNMEEVLNIVNSLIRGAEEPKVFYSFNPPRSLGHWVNTEAALPVPGRLVHHSSFAKVPVEWLGKAFIDTAKAVRAADYKKYQHIYLGKKTGTGLEVFPNAEPQPITDEQIQSFDRIYRGIDWGYATDPAVYICCHFDKTRGDLYVFHEVVSLRMSNTQMAEAVKRENKLNQLVIADSAEPKSIDDLRRMDVRITGAKKVQGSVETGIKWLGGDVRRIIIDPQRCPVAYKEFSEYTVDDKGRFPDENNHTIDAIRYALEEPIMNRNQIGAVQVGQRPITTPGRGGMYFDHRR